MYLHRLFLCDSVGRNVVVHAEHLRHEDPQVNPASPAVRFVMARWRIIMSKGDLAKKATVKQRNEKGNCSCH